MEPPSGERTFATRRSVAFTLSKPYGEWKARSTSYSAAVASSSSVEPTRTCTAPTRQPSAGAGADLSEGLSVPLRNLSMNASIASSVSGPLCANLGASYSNDGARPSAGNRDEGSKLKSSYMKAAVVFCKSTNATSPLSRLATARTACMLGGALRASAASASASFSTKTCATGSAIASSSPRTSHEYRSTSSSECTRSQRDTFPLLKSDAASATTPPSLRASGSRKRRMPLKPAAP
mmetsp:Transcript_37845/g.83319  ORF Transcript_37845/g.83319 Transcript_37845/m.83319 type:complete len:236 (+) Transcript_37845:1113-1820(+)